MKLEGKGTKDEDEDADADDEVAPLWLEKLVLGCVRFEDNAYFNPESFTKYLWDLLTNSFVVWIAVVLPVSICFIDVVAPFRQKYPLFRRVVRNVDDLGDVVFVLDIIATFRTGKVIG